MPIKDDVFLGEDVKVWHPDLCNIYGCSIGKGTSIGAFCEIRKGVSIGVYCKLQSHVFIPEGVIIKNAVFIGPHVCFTNDKHPKATGEWEQQETIIEDFVNIGANATILSGVSVGTGSTIGAGAVVTKNIPAGETWVGNPARRLI